jgi:hypothetical protein
VVFSIVLGEHYVCVGPSRYGVKDCYHETRYARGQVLDYFAREGLTVIEAEHFQAPIDLQTVYRVERQRPPRTQGRAIQRNG